MMHWGESVNAKTLNINIYFLDFEHLSFIYQQ